MAYTVFASGPATNRSWSPDTNIRPSAASGCWARSGRRVSFDPLGSASLARTGTVTTSLTRTVASSGFAWGAWSLAGAGTISTAISPVADDRPLDTVYRTVSWPSARMSVILTTEWSSTATLTGSPASAVTDCTTSTPPEGSESLPR